VTSAERSERDAEVFAARARGLTWPALASEFGLSERQCQRVVASYQASRAELDRIGEPASVVQDSLDSIDAAIEELAELADDTRHDGTRLGAIRARLKAVDRKVDLLHRVGVLDNDTVGGKRDVERVAVVIADVLEAHRVPEDVQLAIAEALSSD
jgi:hypothetical protein